MGLILRACTIELVSDSDESVRWKSQWVEVVSVDSLETEYRWRDPDRKFPIMCDALMGDVSSAEGMGEFLFEQIRRVEIGKLLRAEVEGNGWVTIINPNSVWFEGLHDEEEREVITLAQYKIALRARVDFLSDPEHKTIEVEFPDS